MDYSRCWEREALLRDLQTSQNHLFSTLRKLGATEQERDILRSRLKAEKVRSQNLSEYITIVSEDAKVTIGALSGLLQQTARSYESVKAGSGAVGNETQALFCKYQAAEMDILDAQSSDEHEF